LPSTPRYSVPSWTEKYFPNLRVLSLNRASLDTEAAQKLSTLLETNSALLTNLQHLDVSRNEIEVNGLLALGDKFVLRRHGKLIFNCAGNVMKREERGTVSLYLNFACPQKELIMEDSVELTESHGRLLVELIDKTSERSIQKFEFLCVKNHYLEVPSDSEAARFADSVLVEAPPLEAGAAAAAAMAVEAPYLLEAALDRASDGVMRLSLNCSKETIDNINEDAIREMVQDRLHGWQVLHTEL